MTKETAIQEAFKRYRVAPALTLVSVKPAERLNTWGFDVTLEALKRDPKGPNDFWHSWTVFVGYEPNGRPGYITCDLNWIKE